jgi:hypothetical protein
LALWLLAGAGQASAQETKATLKGLIVGPDGAAVAGARLTIVEQESGLNPRTMTTSETGEYVAADLTPNVYRLTVEANGFKTIVTDSIELLAGDVQELKFTLESGSTQDTITIPPAAPPVVPPPPPPPAR